VALDTARKRASVLGIVWPDGSFDQGDAQTICGIYGGILAGALTLAVGSITAYVTAKPLSVTVTTKRMSVCVTPRGMSVSVTPKP